VTAVLPQHRLLGGGGDEPVPGQANTLSGSTDISGEVKRRFPPQPEGQGLHAALLMTYEPIPDERVLEIVDDVFLSSSPPPAATPSSGDPALVA
jgi:hypothetical protein